MKDTTDEFSFILKPAQYGIGVFAVHGIKSGTHLRMFGDGKNVDDRAIVRNKENVPKVFQQFCADRGDTLLCPLDFGAMSVGWHLNHSKTPNAFHKNYDWYALKDIKEGEEVTIDYNTLEEPEEAKEEYYK